MFEPCEKLAWGLEKTFADEIENGRVILIKKALGAALSQNDLYIDKNMYCASTLQKSDGKNIVTEKVTIDTLDDVLQQYGIQYIDLIKMDIEGAEMDALLGASGLIRKCKPKMMIATYHEYENAIKVKEICEKLNIDYDIKFTGFYSSEKPYRPYMTLAVPHRIKK